MCLACVVMYIICLSGLCSDVQWPVCLACVMMYRVVRVPGLCNDVQSCPLVRPVYVTYI